MGIANLIRSIIASSEEAEEKKKLIENYDGPIKTVESLRENLHSACFVELSTIPLYLYAMYSLQSQIRSYQSSSAAGVPGMSAYRAIRGVVLEEMLHLTLARNLLTAIGDYTYPDGRPFKLYDPKFIPAYPADMLHRVPPLPLHLRKASIDQMDIFMQIELPAPTHAPPESDTKYHTIGQFYEAIEDAFCYLDATEHEKLWGNAKEREKRQALQLQNPDVYWNQEGGGGPILVKDLASALEAMELIVEQGEGNPGHEHSATNPADGTEFSHYQRFLRIADGLDPLGVAWNVKEDPKAADFKPPELRSLAKFFNGCYSYTLILIDAIYETPYEKIVPDEPNQKWFLIQSLLTGMNALLYPGADLLVRQPTGEKDPDGNEIHAGPTFEYFDFGSTGSSSELLAAAKKQLLAACGDLGSAYPSLVGPNSVQEFLGRMPPKKD